MKARTYDRIVVDPQLTPRVWKDLKNGQYSPIDGNIWYKHPSKAPCHWLDAFMHSLHASGGVVKIYKRPVYNMHHNTNTNSNIF